MRRMLHALALLLGLTLLAADPASAAWSQGQKVASGSAAVVELIASESARLSTERAGENPTLSYEIASGSPVAARGAASLEKQAADLVVQNAGRNRVTLRSSNQQLDIDLAGKAHTGIPTPHTKVSPRNWDAPSQYQPAYNTSARNSILRPATQEDIRTARRYLERR